MQRRSPFNQKQFASVFFPTLSKSLSIIPHFHTYISTLSRSPLFFSPTHCSLNSFFLCSSTRVCCFRHVIPIDPGVSSNRGECAEDGKSISPIFMSHVISLSCLYFIIYLSLPLICFSFTSGHISTCTTFLSKRLSLPVPFSLLVQAMQHHGFYYF